MRNNNTGILGCIGPLISLMLPIFFIYKFGFKKVILFLIDSFLVLLILPTVIGLLFFIFKKQE